VAPPIFPEVKILHSAPTPLINVPIAGTPSLG
jgi:hypothetical protein